MTHVIKLLNIHFTKFTCIRALIINVTSTSGLLNIYNCTRFVHYRNSYLQTSLHKYVHTCKGPSIYYVRKEGGVSDFCIWQGKGSLKKMSSCDIHINLFIILY